MSKKSHTRGKKLPLTQAHCDSSILSKSPVGEIVNDGNPSEVWHKGEELSGAEDSHFLGSSLDSDSLYARSAFLLEQLKDRERAEDENDRKIPAEFTAWLNEPIPDASGEIIDRWFKGFNPFLTVGPLPFDNPQTWKAVREKAWHQQRELSRRLADIAVRQKLDSKPMRLLSAHLRWEAVPPRLWDDAWALCHDLKALVESDALADRQEVVADIPRDSAPPPADPPENTIPQSANDPRNKWLYEQCWKIERYGIIESKLAEKKKWEPLTEPTALKRPRILTPRGTIFRQFLNGKKAVLKGENNMHQSRVQKSTL